MPRLSRADSQQLTRTRLLQAARKLVGTGGYRTTSVEAIAEAAGYSKGALYSNFASKEALLVELLRTHLQEENRHLQQVIERHNDIPRLLEAIIKQCETMVEDLETCRLSVELHLEAARDRRLAKLLRAFDREQSQSVEQAVVEVCRKAHRNVSQEEIREIAAGIIALIQGFKVLALQNESLPQVGPVLTRFLQGMLH
jgi:AcrR family transcriptional regulator